MTAPKPFAIPSWFVIFLGIFVSSIGLLALAGWQYDIVWMKSITSAMVAVKPISAVSLAFCGLGLALLAPPSEKSPRRLLGRSVALGLILLGLLSILERLLEMDFGIDGLFFPEKVLLLRSMHPGRMALATDLNLVLYGSGLLLLDTRRVFLVTVRQFLTFLLGLGALITLLGYSYGADYFYHRGIFSSMALQTVVCFALLAIGVLVARPSQGIMVLVTSSTLGGLIVRRLLPMVVILITILAQIRWEGQRQGLYGTAFGLALMVSASITVCAGLVCWTGWTVHYLDLERRKAEVRFREQSERFRVTLQSIGEAVIVTDLDGQITLMNPVAQDLTGWRIDASDRPLREVLPLLNEQSGKAIEDPIQLAVRKKIVVRLADAVQFVKKSGERIPVDLCVARISNDAGNDIGAVLVLRDVTERRIADARIRSKRERLSLAQQAAGVATFEWIIPTDEIVPTPELEALYGLAAGAFKGGFASWLQSIHPDDQPKVKKAFAVAIQECGTLEVEFRLLAPNGSHRWLGTRCRVLRDDTGKAYRLVGVQIDIDQRKQMEEALRQSESQYRLLAEAMPIMVWIFGKDGKMEYANPQWLEFTGIGLEETNAIGWASLLHPDDLALVGRGWQEVQLTGESRQAERRIRRHDGVYRWFLSRIVPIRNESGQVMRWIGTSTDIDDQKRATDSLAYSERRYRALVQASPQIIWSAGEDGNNQDASGWWEKTTGQSPEASHGWGWLEALHPDDRVPVRMAWEHSLQTNSLFEIEYRIHTVKGEYRHFAVRGVPLFDSNGKLEEWVGTWTDISATRNYEQQLRLLNSTLEQRVAERTEALLVGEERFRSAFDSAAVGTALVSPNGKWLQVNRMLCELMGYTETELLAMDFQSITHPDDLELDLVNLQQLLKSQIRTYQPEKRYIRKDGQIIHARSAISLVRDARGEPLYFVTQILDITQQKLAARELLRAKAAAEDASRAKSEFLANMSHEIRTPMNGILGMSDLALDTDLTPQQREYIESVRTSAELLLAIINDILDFSKIEAGKLCLDPVPFALRDSLGDLLKPLALRAHKKSLEIAYSVAPDVPEHLMGDFGRLGQILINLVGNAIKFTENGEVIVRVRAESRDGDELILGITVSDTGIGITPDRMQAIFNPFEQADGSMARRYGGTGLGLSISAGLIAMMGGTIAVDSAIGEGSSFSFTVRMSIQNHSANAFPELMTLNDVPILIIEDSPTMRTILTEMLTQWRMKPTAVSSIEEAYITLAATQTKYPIVVLDDSAVAVDELASGLKDRLPEDTTFLLMTSSSPSISQTLTRYRLSKPIRESDLLELLQQAITERAVHTNDPVRVSTQPAPETPKPIQFSRSLRILLAEDNLINQKVAIEILRQAGHDARIACNGYEVLTAIDSDKFDLILMDIQMPEMDGTEATRIIRDREQATGQHIPIVALTAHAMKGDRERFIALGMDGYVSKPIRQEELWTAIQTCLPETVTGTQSLKPLPTPAVVPSLFNRETLLARLGGNADFLGQMLQLFLEESPKLMRNLEIAISRKEAIPIRRAAHTLKGALGSLSASSAWATAETLELVASSGELGSIDRHFALLQEEIRRFEAEVVGILAGLATKN